jgi:hypothetical protein
MEDPIKREEDDEGLCWPCAISGFVLLSFIGFVVWRFLL